jgi:hypothetical protein
MKLCTRFAASVGLALALGLSSISNVLAVPILSLSATPSLVLPGGSVVVDVTASGFADLYGYQFSLNFSPALFRATSVSEGPFLATGGATFFDGGSIDNTLGAISFVFDTLIGPGPGVTGSGVLSRISFNTLRGGIGNFSLSDVLALNSNLATIAVQTQSLAFAVPEPGVLALLCVAALALCLRRRDFFQDNNSSSRGATP